MIRVKKLSEVANLTMGNINLELDDILNGNNYIKIYELIDKHNKKYKNFQSIAVFRTDKDYIGDKVELFIYYLFREGWLNSRVNNPTEKQIVTAFDKLLNNWLVKDFSTFFKKELSEEATAYVPLNKAGSKVVTFDSYINILVADTVKFINASLEVLDSMLGTKFLQKYKLTEDKVKRDALAVKLNKNIFSVELKLSPSVVKLLKASNANKDEFLNKEYGLQLNKDYIWSGNTLLLHQLHDSYATAVRKNLLDDLVCVA